MSRQGITFDDVRALKVEPGDRVVVTLDMGTVSGVQVEYIAERLKEEFPDNFVLVLDRGMTIEAVSA